WINRANGIREGHQCKRENGRRGKWSIAELAAKGIIANAKYQLDRSANHHFVFISRDKCPELSDFCERANRANRIEEFSADDLRTSKHHRREYDSLCIALNIAPDQPMSLSVLWDFLRRFHIRVIDKTGIHEDVNDVVSRWLEGDVSTIIAK